MKKIDAFLNKITMYRAAVYYLLLLLAAAVGLSFFKLLPFGPLDLVVSAVFITAVCFFSNAVFAWAFNAGIALSRESILGSLWDFEFDSFSNVVDVHMKNLRKKIDGNYKYKMIETVYGVGYRIKNV